MTGPLPGFLVIGAMKAGTSSLHHYLDAHPDLFLPSTKELNYFRDARTHARGEEWYRRHFSRALPGQVAGEVSPDYTKHPHHAGAPLRIKRAIPDVRLVYLLREPVERMRSMYLHQVAAGREKRPIDVALVEDPHYREVSQYAYQLERYLEHFPREQVLVCSTEDLREDRDRVLMAVHRFVGVRELPGTADGVAEVYRGADRRRRGRMAQLASDVAAVRRVFDAIPAPAREALRRAGTRPLPADDLRRLSPEAEAALRESLAPDLERLRALAPEVVNRWAVMR